MKMIAPPDIGSFVEYSAADLSVAEPAIDFHRVAKTGNLPEGVSDKPSVARSMLDVDKWLPYAADVYGTSRDLRDYIVVPTTIFLSELPNSNLAAFTFDELSSWNAQAGRIAYRTWKAKPTHEEHANSDPTQARGVIFDSSLKSVPNYVGGLYRTVLLAGWDRDRFPELAARVAAGRHGYSMGCWVSDYRCSVCDASMRQGECAHLHPKRGVKMPMVGNKLVYRIAKGITGFELSAVRTPAFRSAWAEPIS